MTLASSPRFRIVTVLAALGLSLPATQANLITFEATPTGQTPTDNATLATPFSLTGGGTVEFFFDTNGNNVFDSGVDVLPAFEQVGDLDADAGFVGAGNINDFPEPDFASQLGNWFLRQPNSLSGVPGPFIARYDTTQTIQGLYGEIWDIDGGPGATEAWRIDVIDGVGAVIVSAFSPVGTEPLGVLNALPWAFSFDNLSSSDVAAVRLTFIGTAPSGVGLAFNNFSPLTADILVPEVTSGVVLMAGLAAGTLRRRRH